MYLTQTDIVKLKLMETSTPTTSEFLMEIINAHKNSEDRKEMEEGERYYRLKQKILDHDFREYFIDGIKNVNKNKANEKVVHAYHKLLVDQKISYIASKPVTFTTDEQGSPIADFMNKSNFQKVIYEWLKKSSNNGVAYLHPYINRMGGLSFAMMPGTEIIPIYDTSYQMELIGVMRYYYLEKTLKSNSGIYTPKRMRVEIWTGDKVLYLMENDSGELEKDDTVNPNPRGHWFVYNTLNPKAMKDESWGRVPFVELRNNAEKMTDLKVVKTLIDNYDFNVSDFSNKLIDVARAIWVLKGYAGTSLSEFVKNLNEYGAMKVDKTGSVENKTLDLPYEAHDSHLNRIEDNIFVFGMGVNPKMDKYGNSPSGIALKFMYSGLDLKSNIAINELRPALENTAEFLQTYFAKVARKDLALDGFSATFNKSMLVNDKEIVDMARESKGIISDKTIISNHPWVNNPDEEIKQMEEEEKKKNDPYNEMLNE